MISPISSGESLRKKNSTWLHNFDLLVGEIKMIFREKTWRLNVVMNSYYDFLHAYYNANENIQAYANRQRRNWTETEMDAVQFQAMGMTRSAWDSRFNYYPNSNRFRQRMGVSTPLMNTWFGELTLKLIRRWITCSNRNHQVSHLVLMAEDVNSNHQSQRRKMYLRILPNRTTSISQSAAGKIYLFHSW